MRRRRAASCFALAVYLAAVVAWPALHLRDHARGVAHVHDAARVVESGAAPADLVVLGLEDVAAGPAIDCSLAALTLVDCERPAHGTRRFGDATPEREPPSTPDLDPRHGAGSLEHLGVAMLAAARFVLPPPCAPETRLALFTGPPARSLHHRLTHHPRGPPAIA